LVLLAHVSEDSDRADYLPVRVSKSRCVKTCRNDLARSAARIQTRISRHAAFDNLPERGGEFASLLRADEPRERLFDQFIRLEAEELGNRIVCLEDFALQV